MGIIILKGMEFHSFIGHYDEEKQIGNNFKVDLKFEYDCTKAAQTDKLKYTVDYQKVYNIVKMQMGKKCNLIENVAKRIAKSVMSQFSQIQWLEVTVSKLFPKLGGIVEEVSITIREQRK